MPLFDKPLEELVNYLPPLTAQPDLDAFWAETWPRAPARRSTPTWNSPTIPPSAYASIA
jgi:cephalosporin-C deacetylase-like acetyl esterase